MDSEMLLEILREWWKQCKPKPKPKPVSVSWADICEEDDGDGELPPMVF